MDHFEFCLSDSGMELGDFLLKTDFLVRVESYSPLVHTKVLKHSIVKEFSGLKEYRR